MNPTIKIELLGASIESKPFVDQKQIQKKENVNIVNNVLSRKAKTCGTAEEDFAHIYGYC